MSTPFNQQYPTEPLLISYLTLRKAIGVMGMLLPVILIGGQLINNGNDVIQVSISNYYYTNMGDVFVGVMCAVSLCLFTYKGYDYRDKFTSRIAGTCGFGVALFPTNMKCPVDLENMHHAGADASIPILHLLFALGFFVTLACFSLFLFTESHGTKTREKKIRNRIYKVCGVIMLTCIVLLVVYFLVSTIHKLLEPYKFVFILETIALEAFGASWLVKSEFLLGDKKMDESAPHLTNN